MKCVLLFTTLVVVACAANVSSENQAGPTLATRAPTRVSVVLPNEVSTRQRVPLAITLYYNGDETAQLRNGTLTNYSFLYLLLDEKGQQVAVNPFIREAVTVDLQLKGRQPIYEPAPTFNSYCKQLVPGRKYQLICVLPSRPFPLADSAWFTLTD